MWIVYTDGSFYDGLVSSAGIIKNVDKTVEEFQFFANSEKLAVHRNVSGEILSVMYSIYSAFKQNLLSVEIFHDYEGLNKWISGEWKAKTELTKFYVKFVEEYISKGMKIEFIKVRAHQNDALNNYVDKLAKEAITKKIIKGMYAKEFLKYIETLL
uniref:Ribonuclease H n=1 Tax=Fervidobacterium nodosum TaxID=2424 RepID=A0A7C5U3G0_9BACT